MQNVFAVDTSSIIALISGQTGPDIDLIVEALPESRIIIPPVVYVEACSNHKTRTRMEALLMPIRQLEILPDYWRRASLLRSDILAHKLKANLADTLIAQSCIDHGVALITRDADFRHFARAGGLKLAA